MALQKEQRLAVLIDADNASKGNLKAIMDEVAKYGANEVIVKASGKNKRGQMPKLGNIAIDVIFNEDDGEVAQ